MKKMMNKRKSAKRRYKKTKKILRVKCCRRYMKELVLQYRKYRIYKGYNTLRENDIKYFSVKKMHV